MPSLNGDRTISRSAHDETLKAIGGGGTEHGRALRRAGAVEHHGRAGVNSRDEVAVAGPVSREERVFAEQTENVAACDIGNRMGPLVSVSRESRGRE